MSANKPEKTAAELFLDTDYIVANSPFYAGEPRTSQPILAVSDENSGVTRRALSRSLPRRPGRLEIQSNPRGKWGPPPEACYAAVMPSRKGRKCNSCLGSGEMGTGVGILDCPDCGGEGYLPHPSVLVEWRARDIESAHAKSKDSASSDIRWLVSELRRARRALTEVVTIAQESAGEAAGKTVEKTVEGASSAPERAALLQRIAVTAGCALSLFEAEDLKAEDSPARETEPS